MDERKAFDEVHGNIGPDLGGDLEWLKEVSGVKSLCLVSLTCGTSAHKFAHEAVVMLHHEVLSKSLQHLLNTFMPN